MTIDEKRDQVEAILYQMCEDNIVEAWNIMCEASCRDSEVIHLMDEVDDDLFDGMTARQVHEEYDLSEFCWDDYYYVAGGWSTPRSSSNADDFIDYEELIEYSLENNEDYGDPAIRGVLDEPDTDEDEVHEEVQVQEDAPAVEDKLRAVSLFDSDIALLLTALSAMKQRCESTDNERVTAYAHPIEVLMQELKEAQNA